MAHTVTHDQLGNRYVISVDGDVAGYAAYTPLAGGLDFNHTVVAPGFRGQGLSKPLIAAALDDVRENGGKIFASCSAVAHFVDNNPGYQDLLAK